MSEEQPDRFETRTRELLRESADQLDVHTRSRLAQARFAAVEAARKRGPGGFAWRGWMPIGGVAAAAMAVMLWSGGLNQSGVHQPHRSERALVQTPLDDLDLIAADENLEMIEDVDFYSWLDADAAPESSGVG